jgi:hypothetical protein
MSAPPICRLGKPATSATSAAKEMISPRCGPLQGTMRLVPRTASAPAAATGASAALRRRFGGQYAVANLGRRGNRERGRLAGHSLPGQVRHRQGRDDGNDEQSDGPQPPDHE